MLSGFGKFKVLSSLDRAEQRLTETLTVIEKMKSQSKVEDWKKEIEEDFVNNKDSLDESLEEDPLARFQKLSRRNEKEMLIESLKKEKEDKHDDDSNEAKKINREIFQDYNDYENEEDFHGGIEAINVQGEKNLKAYKFNKFVDDKNLINQMINYQLDLFGSKKVDNTKGKILKKLILESIDEDISIPSEDYEELNTLKQEQEYVDEAEIVEEKEKEDVHKIESEIIEAAKLEAQNMIEQAKSEIEELRKQVIAEEKEKYEQEGEKIKEESRKIGFEQGFDEGFEQGKTEGLIVGAEQANEEKKKEADIFAEQLNDSLEQFEEEKARLLKANSPELINLSLAVAEKITRISLKNSKEVVVKMIEAAAESTRNNKWAKVYISEKDKEITVNARTELLDILSIISKDIKVVVMEEEPEGTCIIETEDEIIDASLDTQLNSIKQIVEENKGDIDLVD